MNPFLGEIRLMSFNFAPKGWAQCTGQLLSIQQNAALFAVLGTYYGGNGVQNFALPDLRSRVPVHMGSGPFGTYTIGEIAGFENVTLMITETPAHQHLFEAVNAAGGATRPFNKYLAQSGTTNPNDPRYAAGSGGTTVLNGASIQPNGGSQPHTNIQPYLAMNYCIAMQGIFPTRN